MVLTRLRKFLKRILRSAIPSTTASQLSSMPVNKDHDLDGREPFYHISTNPGYVMTRNENGSPIPSTKSEYGSNEALLRFEKERVLSQFKKGKKNLHIISKHDQERISLVVNTPLETMRAQRMREGSINYTEYFYHDINLDCKEEPSYHLQTRPRTNLACGRFNNGDDASTEDERMEH